MADPLNFEELFRRESELLAQASEGRTGTPEPREVSTPGPAGEPWVRCAPVARVGLAFSGGGIRSATFNLGVLKALHELGVLKHVDYLSTVSGGGYIGAWWSAWRARWGGEFPETVTTSQHNTDTRQRDMTREPEEVRHLREFSNFLSARIGFFQSEMWNAIIAVLSAVLPAVVVASAVMALAFLVWLGFSSLILVDALNLPLPTTRGIQALLGWLNLPLPGVGWFKGWLAPLAISLVIIAPYLSFERRWRGLGKAEQASSKGTGLAGSRFTAGRRFSLCLHWLGWAQVWRCHLPGLKELMFNAVPKTEPPSWTWATGIMPPQDAVFSFSPAYSPYLFAGPILWAAIAALILVPRLVYNAVSPRASQHFGEHYRSGAFAPARGRARFCRDSLQSGWPVVG